jgi:hypothetical protein
MTALSADRKVTVRGQVTITSYLVAASTTLYKGGLVAINAAGYAVPAADTSGLIVVGVAQQKYDNSSGANGAIRCQVESDALFLMGATSIAQAAVPEVMYVADDQTVDETDPGNSVIAGKLTEVVSATSGWVYIPGHGRTKELT